MRQLLFFLTIFLLSPYLAQAEEPDPLALPPEEFFNRDLTVFSPAKKAQKLKNTSSAIYILTSEDIRRSAATTLIDVIRLLPGIQVARVSSHEWAISARGFNQVYGNKILLLIDGIPVETPLFNGILWENINVPLDIIDRIECVRGPGAAIWGTRAMNGLINVITKDAFTFPHNRVSVGGGNEQQGSAYVRTGKVLSEAAAVQVHGKFDQLDSSRSPSGGQLNDKWKIYSLSSRADLKPTNDDKVRLVAGFTGRKADFELDVPTLQDPFVEQRQGERENNRASFSALWDHTVSEDSVMSLEWANLFERRSDLLLDFEAFYSDLEFRHRLKPSENHELSYGLNVRFFTDDTVGSDTLGFRPQDSNLQYYRGFVHDDITLINETLTLTLGSRFEQNEQVGFAALPTARIIWNVSDVASVWAAISRTQGNPSRVYDNIRLNASAFREETSGLPALAQVIGNTDLKSEKLMAYEIGTWIEPVKNLYLSATTFFFHYKDVINNLPGEPTPVLDGPNPYILVPLPYQNGLSSDSIGTELTADWKVADWVDLAAVYSYLSSVAHPQSSVDKDFVENDPRHMANVQARFNLTSSVELDGVLRFVDRLPRSDVDSYIQADIRLGWFVRKDVELELIGRNLLEQANQEFAPLVFQTPISQVERSVFARVNFTF